MKIIMSCSASPDFVVKYKKCLESQKNYCEKYNYDYAIDDNPLESGQTNAEWKWKKHYTLFKYRKTHDIFVSIDADCMIKDITPPLESVIDDHDIYYVNGISNRPNSGFLIVKNTAIGNFFHEELIRRRNNPVPENCKVKVHGDNGHVIWVLSELKNKAKELPIEWNCSQPEFQNSAYILHYTNKLKSKFKDLL